MLDYMNTPKPLIFNTGSEGQGVAKIGGLELENQQGCEPFEGSNPSLSAINQRLSETRWLKLE